MPDRSRKKRPSDVNRMAADIVSEATSDPDSGKDPNAVALGRKGGLKGGPARAKSLSAAKRVQVAKKAAAARWKGHKKK